MPQIVHNCDRDIPIGLADAIVLPHTKTEVTVLRTVDLESERILEVVLISVSRAADRFM